MERTAQKERRRVPRSVIIITGLSGAGKSYASRALEDAGYYCVDNLPPDLITQFVELAFRSGRRGTRLALVCDVRGGTRFQDLFQAMEWMGRQGISHRIVFLEANDEVLLRRFSETRRRHPLDSGSLREDIARERKLLEEVRSRADVLVDTSDFSVSRLRDRLMEIADRRHSKGLNVVITSFGFKYGLPVESDLVFDVRFLPNPHYVSRLAPMTGRDREVQDYVFKSETTSVFYSKLVEFIDFLMPQFSKEGKSHVTISIGCTGGRHRSVTFVERVSKHLRDKNYHVIVDHRDLVR